MTRLFNPLGWRLGIKLAVMIGVVITGVALTIGLVSLLAEHRRLRATLEDQVLLLAGNVAAAIGEPVLQTDYWRVYKTLRTMTAEAPVLDGMVLDIHGRVLAHLSPRANPLGIKLQPSDPEEQRLLQRALAARSPRILMPRDGEAFIEGVVPLRVGNTQLGVVRLRLSTAVLVQQWRDAAKTLLGLTVLLAAAGSALGALASHYLVGPLRRLAHGMETVGRGELNDIAHPHPYRSDEIGQLITRFNRMTGELREKRRLEKDLVVSEKLAALGRISAGVAHEVNNPLSGMLNCVATLKSRDCDPKLVRRYLPLIEKGLNHIRAIVQALLIELRAEQAEARAGPECLDDIRALIDAEIGARPVDLRWDNRLPAGVRLNPARVQQVVLNLLQNALGATPPGGHIAFRAFTRADAVVLEIEDDGVGMDDEMLGRIFDPFYTTRPTGTGLGLWITYRLVESLGGDIEVASEPGKGSLFRIVLPLNDLSEIAA